MADKIIAEKVAEQIRALRNLLLQRGLFDERRSVSPVFAFDRETLFDLLVSRTIMHALNNDEAVNEWINARLKNMELDSRLVTLNETAQWHVESTGNITHESGRFFTITGLRVRHRTGYEENEWDQPIIDQPEVGILGILAKKFDGVLHFCIQAKEEPGNINSIQLAPTVQATYSNYTRVHGGKSPHFIDLFIDPPAGKLLFSRLQAEDGGRFLFKSNKNMVVIMAEDEPVKLPQDFIWLTLRQIGGLMERDNTVNYCARSVLSCLI